jgi:large subunit ribosomal protein L23
MGLFHRTKKEQPVQEEAQKVKVATVKAGAVGSSVILRPIVTEKAAHLSATGQYLFAVDLRVNKIQIRNAIRSMYGITPTSVNIQKVGGKVVRYGRIYGVRKDWKKAIVTLPKGKKIEVYEGV